MPQLPDVVPLAEAAPELKGYELLNWFGLFAPAATPDPILARLNEIVTTALRDKAIAGKLEAQGIVPRIMTAQARAFVVAEAEKFGRIVAQANIKAENRAPSRAKIALSSDASRKSLWQLDFARSPAHSS